MEKKVRIEYLLSEKGRKASLLAGGDGKEKQIVYADLSQQALELATVNSEGNAVIDLAGGRMYLPEEITIKGEYHPQWSDQAGWTKYFYFDAPQTGEALVVWEAARRAGIGARKAELAAEFERLEAEYTVKKAREHAEREERIAREHAERDAHREAEEKARAEAEVEKATWIAEYGSDFLKRAVALDYDCQRCYVTERAALELPDFQVDFDDQSRWSSRSCPSPEALTEVEALIAKGYDAKVAWLTRGITDDDDEDEDEYEEYEPEFEECEAIVIRGFCGKYDLVKVV